MVCAASGAVPYGKPMCYSMFDVTIAFSMKHMESMK